MATFEKPSKEKDVFCFSYNIPAGGHANKPILEL